MKKIVLVSDSPYATTGLGRVSKYFLKMFPDYEWSVWGFLHPNFNIRKGKYYPHYSPDDFEAKFKLLTPKSYTDNQFGMEFVPAFVEAEDPDILLTSFDFDKCASIVEQLVEMRFTMKFKWINYFPMDREDYKPVEIDLLRFPDINVCITKFGVEKIREINPKIKIHQIYHPIDEAEFPELTKKELLDFKVNTWKDTNKKTFMLGTVNRSFARKDTARLVVMASKFLKDVENAYCYIHGSVRTFEGLNLANLAFENGLPAKKLSFMPQELSEVDGASQEAMNKVYRNLDLFVTASSGEGFGFSTVEALLTETPIIAPNNTCFPELIQDFGYLMPTTEKAFHYNGTTTMWPVINVDDTVKQMKYVYDNYAEAKDKAKRGSKWVKDNLNLKVIAEQWRTIFESCTE